MGMDVDEARCERLSVAGYTFVRVAIGEVPDSDDSAVGDTDIGRERRPTTSIEDVRALEDRPEQRLT